MGDEAQIDFFEVTVELDGQCHQPWKFRVCSKRARSAQTSWFVYSRNGVTDTYASSGLTLSKPSLENYNRLGCMSLLYSIMIYKFGTLRCIERYRVFVAKL